MEFVAYILGASFQGSFDLGDNKGSQKDFENFRLQLRAI